MYDLSEGFYEEGKKEGEENRLVEDIASLMQNCGLCESKAMDALDVSEEERPEISARLHAYFN